MTPSEAAVFEKGKTYSPFVLFVSKKDPMYLNVRMEDGSCFKVEVSGTPTTDVQKLKDKTVDLVCTEVTDKRPEFALASKYYTLPAAAAPAVPALTRQTRGGQTGLKESQTLELKSSLVFSPTTHQPDSDQPFEIAKEIAALMNTAGGDLYLGVDDHGFVTGIEGDLPHLGEAPIMMDKVLDDKYDYHPDFDHFTTKLTTAVRCSLGTAAAALVGQPEAIPDPAGSGLRFVRVPVKPSPDVVYLGREESVVYRAQTSVLYLKGRQRELYVRERFYGGASAGPGSEQIDAL
ncbi:MAG: ATP-binding protein, partial [Clostridia bacterium]|nr:ATP-binding protein [Clostridia bacterium]